MDKERSNEKWNKPKPIEPIVVGLSDEQVISWCDYIDWEENSYYAEKFTGWLKTQTFAPILKREPLSDETIAILWGEEHSGSTQMVRDFARVIEKAHGIGE